MAQWRKVIVSGSAAELSSLTLDTALPVAQGGIGATSLTDKAVLISQDSGTDAVGAVALTSNGQLIIGGGDGPAAATLTGTSLFKQCVKVFKPVIMQLAKRIQKKFTKDGTKNTNTTQA